MAGVLNEYEYMNHGKLAKKHKKLEEAVRKVVEKLEDKAHSAWGGKAHDAYQDAADMVESLLGGV